MDLGILLYLAENTLYLGLIPILSQNFGFSKYTEIRSVLDVKIICHQRSRNRHGIEIHISSTSGDNTQSLGGQIQKVKLQHRESDYSRMCARSR